MRRAADLAAGALVALIAGAALPSAAPATTGGAYASPRPSVSAIRCATGCAGLDAAREGSLVRVSGRRLDAVRTIVFLGAKGRGDDVRARAAAVRAQSVDVKVPPGARSGRVRVVNSDGRPSRASRARLAVGRRAAAGSEGPAQARVLAPRALFDAEIPATVGYVVTAQAPLDVMVRVLSVRTGREVALLPQGVVPPGELRSAAWDGTTGGRVAGTGRYEFQLLAAAPGHPHAPIVADRFSFVRHVFPVRGDHDFGGDAARFGAGRDGHNHQGHDVFARCGTGLVAARGGVVKHKAFHGRAGHYVVIDGHGTGFDYAYMHLRRASPLAVGDRVRSGQPIGEVGDTGRASGCHLHFEMWSGGWQQGTPRDPLRRLQRWAKRG